LNNILEKKSKQSCFWHCIFDCMRYNFRRAKLGRNCRKNANHEKLRENRIFQKNSHSFVSHILKRRDWCFFSMIMMCRWCFLHYY